MPTPLRRFRIARLDLGETEEAHRFHLENLGDFLRPRSAETFASHVQRGLAYAARENGRLVAVCFVDNTKEEEPEFGGVFALETCRGLGVAFAVGAAALAALLAIDQPTDETVLVAHVHERNPDPRPLLERLGFQFVRQVKPPPEGFPPTMINEAGEVIGDEFHYRWPRCNDLADAILKLTRDGHLKKCDVAIELVGQLFQPPILLDTLVALRGLAARS